MTPENYVELAKCTEPDSEQYKDVIQRYKDSAMFLETFYCLQELATVCQKLDVYKRGIFYGKPVDLDRPDFEVTEDRVDHADETFIRLLHAGMGLATEAGEFVEALIAYINTGEIDLVNLAEEIGDVQWYSAIGSDATQVPLAQIMYTNIKKLQKRFGDKFSEKQAIIRDLDSEREILDTMKEE